MNPSIDLTKLSPEAAARAVSRLAWAQRCLFVLVALVHGLAVAWLLSVFHGFLLAVLLASGCVLMVMVWSYRLGQFAERAERSAEQEFARAQNKEPALDESVS